ncbi:restriction endonuclease subunit S [uncultured Helicobacter sp.]|uniref:restriction endonuclease subunit S n=1 Tax=uncultured Helicobacter sp. TaxID=175537 RepID=UPI0026048DE2|nr:restriction endonuclease subunit S [uncultured Helicobacter sp.]
MASIEERIEDRTKQQLGEFGISYYTKTESINSDIDSALAKYPSKSGGSGKNYPDIKLFLTTETRRKIPVMIEVKGTKGRLEKLKNGAVENTTSKGEPHYKNINDYALNGAVHYANAILDYTHSYDEVIALGINGYEDASELKTQYAFYYLNRKNLSVPKKIGDFSDLSCFSKEHLESFITKLDSLSLDEKERENAIENLESDIESKLNALNQFLHDELLNINPNTRVALLVGMIMAAQGVKGKIAPLRVEELKCEQGANSNDGQIFLNKIKDFLCEKNLPQEKVAMVINDLESAFIHSKLHTPSSYAKDLLHTSDESPLKKTYQIVLDNILPLVKKLQTADIAGRLFNSITKWLEVPDNEKNDVVLTPRYVVDMMVSLAGVNKDSFVWDYATGSGAFLISAMNAMIKDANTLQSPKEIEAKIAHIKAYQLLGIEKRSDIYLLGILNMILLDDGSANLLHKDSLKDFNGSYEQGDKKGQNFPADVFLLNPPYSASGKGFIFVERALRKMSKGRACVIIQENAGSGNGLPYTADILKHSTLLASIKMPSDLFAGKSSVQTAIYVFEVGKAHNVKQMVKFIDFSSDGYTRAARKKAKASTNLKDTDNAKARYEELINVVLYGSGYLHYYKDSYIEDTINLEGRDWTYSQHKKIDTTPTLADFKKCVSEYLAWEVSNVLKNSCHTERSEVSKNTQADSINGGMEGNALSPRLVKLEAEFKQNGGEWKSFRIGELFDHLKPIKHTYNKGNLPTEPTEECDLPAITCTSANQGIACYMPRNGAEILKNVISVAANGDAPAFYQPHDFAILQDAYALRFKSELIQESVELSPLCYLYLTALLQKVLQKYNWNDKSGWAKVSQEIISLPILLIPSLRGVGEAHNEAIHKNKADSQVDCHEVANATSRNDKNTKSSDFSRNDESDYEIAFSYMESYIKELEAERLEELEAYLKVTGLNDYTLSQKEKEALRSFENLSIPQEAPLKWKSFKCEKLFSVKSNPQLNKDSFSFGENAPYPYFTRTCLNNGIAGYVEYLDEEHKIKGESIAVGMLGMQFFYMQKDFYAGQFTKTLYPKFNGLNATIAQFFITWLNKHQRIFQGVLVRDFEKTFNETEILLPVLDSHNIDFDFIESFIKAIEKECIKSVVLWQTREAKAYKQVVETSLKA